MADAERSNHKRASDGMSDTYPSPRRARGTAADGDSRISVPSHISVNSPFDGGGGAGFSNRGDLALEMTTGMATASPLAAEAAASLAAIASAQLPPPAVAVAGGSGRNQSKTSSTSMLAPAPAVPGGGSKASAAGKKGGKRKAANDGEPAAAGGSGGKSAGKSSCKSGGGSGSGSGGGGSSSSKPVPSIHVGGLSEGSIAANVGAGGKRRLTRGVVPALKNELEELMASAPVAPPEGWVKKPDGSSDESAPRTWEGWESRLKDERVPVYVIEDLWHVVRFLAKQIEREARQPPEIFPTLEVEGVVGRDESGGTEPGTGALRGGSPPSGITDEGVLTWEELLSSVASDIPFDQGDEESLHAISADLLLGGGDGTPRLDASAPPEDMEMTKEDLARHLAGEFEAETAAPPSAAPAAAVSIADGPSTVAAANTTNDGKGSSCGGCSCSGNGGCGGGGGGGGSGSGSGGGISSGGNGGGRGGGDGGGGDGGGGAAAAAASSSSSKGPDLADLEPAYWARDLYGRLKRLLSVGSTPITFGQLYYLLMGTLAGHTKLVNVHVMLPHGDGGGGGGGGGEGAEGSGEGGGGGGGSVVSKEQLVRSNLAHHAVRRARRLANELMDAFLTQCKRTARAMRLDVALAGGAVELRAALRALLAVGSYGQYEVMTKEAYNELIGQKPLWLEGERQVLLEELCTRDGETMITPEYFEQHTSKNSSEVYVLVHLPTRRIAGLAAVADFQTPWTAGQFHHMAHACQEDRMFFLGRKSEKDLTPKVALDMNSSFEGGTRWTSHFHMPTLLAVDVICVRPGTRGLAHILLAHLLCITSSFTADRTHVLFDISGREKNVRMCKFAASIGAIRCQTYADEARSEGYVGVEGDDPSIYWTYKDGSKGFGANDGKTSGVYAVDIEADELISTQHPAVIFNDRVTLADFHRGTKNCSYFAVAPLEMAQGKLAAILRHLRAQTVEAAPLPQPPWRENAPAGAGAADPDEDAPPADAAAAADTAAPMGAAAADAAAADAAPTASAGPEGTTRSEATQ